MKKFKVFTIILAIIFSLTNSITFKVFAEESSVEIGNLYALSAALIDGDTGRVLYEKEGNKVRPMASTTKIMTLIIALEYGNSEDIITVSSYASKMPAVKLGIREGEQYKLSDLYYSLMLESHNDVAVAIAEHIGGDVKGFSAMMNKKAMELGLTNTYFITANGLDASDEFGTHSTTAIELARLMKYCVMESPKREEFKAICQTPNYSFTDYEKNRSFDVSNKNAFLNMMDGVLAGKTGFTADAGYCYVVSVTRDDRTLIVALLGCGWPNNKSYKWKDTKTLLEYGFENYNITQITDSGTPMKNINIPNGTPLDNIDTYINDYVSILMGKNETIKLNYHIPMQILPPIRAGDIVGYIDILINDETFRTINVYASSSIEVKDYKYYIKIILNTFF